MIHKVGNHQQGKLQVLGRRNKMYRATDIRLASLDLDDSNLHGYVV